MSNPTDWRTDGPGDHHADARDGEPLASLPVGLFRRTLIRVLAVQVLALLLLWLLQIRYSG
jgi:hypothetical protein